MRPSLCAGPWSNSWRLDVTHTTLDGVAAALRSVKLSTDPTDDQVLHLVAVEALDEQANVECPLASHGQASVAERPSRSASSSAKKSITF